MPLVVSNTFLKMQQDESEDGNVLLTLVKFNHKYEIACNGIDIRDFKPLDNTTFVPDGMTAFVTMQLVVQ